MDIRPNDAAARAAREAVRVGAETTEAIALGVRAGGEADYVLEAGFGRADVVQLVARALARNERSMAACCRQVLAEYGKPDSGAELITDRLRSAAVELDPIDPESLPVSWHRLFHEDAEYYARDGRGPWSFTRADLEALYADWETHGRTELPVDLEHESLWSDDFAVMGWIETLELRDDGLYCQIRWLETGSWRIESRQVRYLSPVWYVDDDGRMRWLWGAAVVKSPAIGHQEPLVASTEPNTGHEPNRQPAEAAGIDHPNQEEADMSLHKIAASLGTDVKPDPEAIAAAVNALRERNGELTSELEAASTRADELQGQLETLRLEARTAEAEREVAAAIEAGKLNEDQREWATTLAIENPESWAIYCSTAPANLPPQGNRITDGDRKAAAVKAAAGGDDRAAQFAVIEAHAKTHNMTLKDAAIELAAKER